MIMQHNDIWHCTGEQSPFTYILRLAITDVDTIRRMHFSSGSLYPWQRTVGEMTGGMLALPASLLQLPKVNTCEPIWHYLHHEEMKEMQYATISLPVTHILRGLQRRKQWCGRCHLISTIMYHPPPLRGKWWQRCVEMWRITQRISVLWDSARRSTCQGNDTNLAPHSCTTKARVNPMRWLAAMSSTDHWSSVSRDYTR